MVLNWMSQKDALIARLKSKPKDFTISELDSLMSKCGCRKSNRGKTSGSAIAYIHIQTNQILRFHTPHPKKELKRYMIDDVLDFLKDVSEI